MKFLDLCILTFDWCYIAGIIEIKALYR